MRKLRIFYASDTTPNAWFKSVRSNIWRNNLLLPLLDLGHDVVEFNYDLTETFRYLNPALLQHADFIARNRPIVTRALLDQLKAAHQQNPIDLLFTYFTDACIEPHALDEIRALGIRTVNWYCNGSYLIDLVREISPRYDFVLVPEKFRMQDYTAMGARPIYCQEAANPAIYKPAAVEQEFDVTFIGQAYGDRPHVIRQLLNAGINVHVWGHGWKNPHPRGTPKDTYDAILAIPEAHRHETLSDEDLVTMYSRSKINLGLSTCGDTANAGGRIVQIRLRDFEVPMAGGFYLVEAMDELCEFFVIGHEIDCYRTPAELIEKVRHYLQRPAERERIRAAGHARARRDHSWHRRFEAAFAQMGLS